MSDILDKLAGLVVHTAQPYQNFNKISWLYFEGWGSPSRWSLGDHVKLA